MLYPCPSLGILMPSLVQWIVGSGTPDAVQAMTTGDSLVTVSSVGSSAIDGGTVWEKRAVRAGFRKMEIKLIEHTF